MQSAERIEKRQETDTIELVDDIRYYLNERFRMRMEDMGIYSEDEDESGEYKANEAESPYQSNEAKKVIVKEEKEKMPPGNNKELVDDDKQSNVQEELNLNTEATHLYDSLLGQIDELLGLYLSSL